MKIFNNIILNTIEVVLCFFVHLSCGYDKVYDTQTIYYNEKDNVNVKVSFRNVPNNVIPKPKLFYSNHNELPNLEFQRALNRGMNGSVLYAFFVDGDINNSAKVLEFILTQKQISQDNRHACLKESGCEIVISEWDKKNRKYYEKQTIEYNLYDDVNVLITLKNEPLDVTKRDLRQTGTNVLENVNSTIHHERVLTGVLSETNLYVEGYDMFGVICYNKTVILYKYLDKQIIPSARKHACLSSCEIIIDLHEGHKYCNGTTKKNPASKEIDTKVIDRNDKGGKEIDRKVIDRNETGVNEIDRKVIDRNDTGVNEIDMKVIERNDIGNKKIDRNVIDRNNDRGGKEMYRKVIDRNDADGTGIDRKAIDGNDTGEKSYVLVLCVVGSICFIILMINIYVCRTHIKIEK